MPLQETLPVDEYTDQWAVWGTTARIVLTDPGAVPAARSIVDGQLAAIDEACSRFRPDSELSRVQRTGGPQPVSALLAELVAVALGAAARTDGDVDPTVGAVLCGLGYDLDFSFASARSRVTVFARPDWRRIGLHGQKLTVPSGLQLDLGATAKAYAADRCARLVAGALGTGVLVSLGGDIATAGPSDGWRVLVQDGPDEPAARVRLPAGKALATSSTISRQWDDVHHIVDPRTCLPAPRVWRTASVAADRCVEANTRATAALVRGERAVPWLRRIGATSRLVRADGSIVTTGRWPR
jgi:thiamine biosynthesis lipoprotein